MSQQLAYSGLIEVAKVRHAGFAHRRDFDSFFDYFKLCLTEARAKELLDKTAVERVEALLADLKIDKKHYLIGRSLVFLQKKAHAAFTF